MQDQISRRAPPSPALPRAAVRAACGLAERSPSHSPLPRTPSRGSSLPPKWQGRGQTGIPRDNRGILQVQTSDAAQSCHLVRCGRVTPPGKRSTNVRGRGVLAIGPDRICILLTRENDILVCLLNVALLGFGLFSMLHLLPRFPSLWPLWCTLSVLAASPLLYGVVSCLVTDFLGLEHGWPVQLHSRWFRRTVLLKADPAESRMWLHADGRIACLEVEDGRWLVARAKNPNAIEVIKELWRVCRGVTCGTGNDAAVP